MNCKKAKEISLVDYLYSLDIKPKRRVAGGYLYLSPLRIERNPSFKVDATKNVYFDHGGDKIKNGGTIIDFGVAYHRCSISKFLHMLDEYVSSHPVPMDIKIEPQLDPQSEIEKKIAVVSEGPITSPALIRYLRFRKIPLELAQRFYCEVIYKLYKKLYYAIGFKNDKGGYELRNPRFKGSASPKAPTFIDRGFDEVEVFEGSMSFSSFLVVYGNWEELESNFIILNSLSFFEKARPLLEKHRQINLHLDRDKAGMKRTLKALGYDPKYRNASVHYWCYNDWNDFLTKKCSQKRLQILKQFSGSKGRRKMMHLISTDNFLLKKKRSFLAPVAILLNDENFNPNRSFL
jgi:hypothetical protein